MARLRLPKNPALSKDYTKNPWTPQTAVYNPLAYAQSILKKGVPLDNLRDYLFLETHLDRRKADLLTRTLKQQGRIVKNDNEVMMTINIPFCAWRCFNCKRVMYQLSKSEDIYSYYYDNLMREVELARQIVAKKCYIVKSVYYMGNLLALDNERMERLLATSAFSFSETCVEIGNPAFVTREKLAILKKYRVTRLIFNALTFNLVSLRKLCRRFEFNDFYEAYKLVAEFGFDVNIELAVGMMEEKTLQVKRNIQLAIDLGATNIDLYVRGCPFSPEELPLIDPKKIADLRKTLETVYDFMIDNGYEPYFVYNTEIEHGCFENVGYTIPNKKCCYFEDKVQGISTIIGCGTNATSILVKNLHNQRTLITNPYDIGQYILGIEEYLDKKRKFFGYDFTNK
ncbi:MAG: hypothetical protein IJU58_02370 [Clostridia bacterium]|nr:hypothetical protein [Clostridia bacterium]